MEIDELADLPVGELVIRDSVLFMWVAWPHLFQAWDLFNAWGFEYKTCAFTWMKADVSTLDLFSDPVDADMGLGYWTRSNSEVCLLGTRGQPTRVNAAVRQGIIEPAREHSRKPDCVHHRIQRLVGGPFVELFARRPVPLWAGWGRELTKFGYNPALHQITKNKNGTITALPNYAAHMK